MHTYLETVIALGQLQSLRWEKSEVVGRAAARFNGASRVITISRFAFRVFGFNDDSVIRLQFCNRYQMGLYISSPSVESSGGPIVTNTHRAFLAVGTRLYHVTN